MDLNSKYHEKIEYNEEEVITFSKGLPGFEQLKKFIIFKLEDNEDFNVLHSLENNEIGFVVTTPFSIVNNYEFKLTEEILKELEIKDEKEVLVLNTVTLNSDISKITVNLKAPIIINIKSKLGAQIILDNEKYSIKHPLVKG